MKEGEAPFLALKYCKDAMINTPDQPFFDNFGRSLFTSKLSRLLIKKGKAWKPFLKYVILTMIFAHAFIIRQFSFIRFGPLIHEFDPYFNLRATEYLHQNGLKSFWNWFDDGSWYPLGRPTGHSIYPGLMLSTYFIHTFLNGLGLHISINDMCVFIAPLFSGLTTIFAYKIGKKITGNSKTGLLAAFFIGISPSYLSRSVAGSYDNEAVAIFGLVLSFYGWIMSMCVGNFLNILLSSIFTFYLIFSWGGYVFVINTIAIFIVILTFLGRLTLQTHFTFTSYYILINTLLLNVPFIGINAFKSSELLGPHAVFLLTHVYVLVKHVQPHIPVVNFKKLIKIFSFLIVFFFSITILFLSATGKTALSVRSRTLLDPTYAPNYHPLVASISEHQTPTWVAYTFDLGLIILFCPVGLYICLKSPKNIKFFVAVYALFAFYFSGIMIRLMLVVGPASGILAALGISYLIENFMNYLRPPSLLAYAKAQKNEKKHLEEIAKVRISPIFSIITICICGLFCMIHAFHCTWAAGEAYSHPTVVSRTHLRTGAYLQDDYREAYTWLRYNTHPKSRIFSWWDYGYQTAAMANRTVMVDNNTWNHTHIATVGLAFGMDEQNAYQILRKMDMDYVLVVYGGLIGYPADDMNKFLWMVRIAGGDYYSIDRSNYLANGRFTIEGDAPKALYESLMYKLAYYNVHFLNTGRDLARNQMIGHFVTHLDFFEEAYSTENFLIRIYKVKKEPNLIGIYRENIELEIEEKILMDD